MVKTQPQGQTQVTAKITTQASIWKPDEGPNGTLIDPAALELTLARLDTTKFVSTFVP